MKKIISIFIISSILLVSCGNSKKEETPKTKKAVVQKKITPQENIAKGKKLFGAKGCTACHFETTKIIGPSVKDIAEVYKKEKGEIFKFLRGENDPIVDLNTTQVAIMKANITSMVDKISDEDLANIIIYIKSVK